MNGDGVVIINLSGRGDKDIFTIADALGDTTWKSFITTKAEEYRA
jgi:tryptophan synthase beta chain